MESPGPWVFPNDSGNNHLDAHNFMTRGGSVRLSGRRHHTSTGTTSDTLSAAASP